MGLVPHFLFSKNMGTPVRIRRSVFERLFFDPSRGPEGMDMVCSVDQLRDAVARDLEHLLNSRAFLTQIGSAVLGNAERSVVCFGVGDFSAYFLSNSEDRQKIADDISRAIAIHEPRLKQVEINFRDEVVVAGALRFNIKGKLVVRPNKEAVSFDAVLQPALSKYKVTHTQIV
jgi:type VI secretion system protein ImpF